MEIHLNTLFYPFYNWIIDYKMEKDGAACTKKCILPWFNAITDAEETLRRLRASLMAAQREAEELYVSGEAPGPRSREG